MRTCQTLQTSHLRTCSDHQDLKVQTQKQLQLHYDVSGPAVVPALSMLRSSCRSCALDADRYVIQAGSLSDIRMWVRCTGPCQVEAFLRRLAPMAAGECDTYCALIIVGAGHHSEGGKAKIKPEVKRWMQERGVVHGVQNIGAFGLGSYKAT